jgi:hypothetical protein
VINDFVVNKGKEAGPGSKEGNCGIERPVDCRFNNDGSCLYVVDFGMMTTEREKPTPYRNTGVLWCVQRTMCAGDCPSGPGGAGPGGYYRRGEPIGRPIPITTEARARGQVIYMRHCYACHQGDEGGLGPALLQLALGPIVRTQIRAGAIFRRHARLLTRRDQHFGDERPLGLHPGVPPVRAALPTPPVTGRP